MSWTFEGVRYHDHNEYERAKQQAQRRTADREAATLRRSVDELESSLRERDRQFEAAQEDIVRQSEVVERVRSDVQGLHRAQAQLRSLQTGMEARLDRDLGQVRSALAGQAERLSQAERDHTEHARQVRETFESVERRIEDGLQEAEARRARSEERLRASLEQVDRKFEEDLARRLASQQDRLQRAAEHAAAAEERAASRESEHAVLELSEEAQSVREQVSQARQLAARQDAESALAVARSAMGEARTLEHRVTRRRARLQVARETLLERIRSIRGRLDQPDLRHYFARESGLAEGILKRVEQAASGRYTRFGRLEIESSEDDHVLARLEEQVLAMSAATPVVKDLAAARKADCDRVLRLLAGVHGPLSSIDTRFAVEGDRKSALVMHCDFGGERVDVRLDLDGSLGFDGYGHGSDFACSRRGQQLLAALEEDRAVMTRNLEGRDRATPRTAAAGTEESWRGLGARLSELEREIR